MAISTTRKATFEVTLNKASAQSVEVTYATVAETAVSGTDFAPVSGKLTFAPGQTTKTVDVFLGETSAGGKTFKLALSNNVNCELASAYGQATIGSAVDPTPILPGYLDRFDIMYAALKAPANGYFGPPSGAKAKTIPYHCPEHLIAEAPDYGHESVSETMSFYLGLETWQGVLHSDWTGYTAAWGTIESSFIPSATNQPIGTYTNDHPADYLPEGDTPQAYPTNSDPLAPVGVDPLYQELVNTYSSKGVFLMHWLVDVDGAFGFKNGDGSKQAVFINNFQRGLQESTFETVTFGCWEDWQNGGGQYGFLPLFSKGTPTYPEADYPYAKQWRYTCAPDAEGRTLQWAFYAAKEAAGPSTLAGATKAKKMGDYLRYCLFDKYFREIGNFTVGATWSAPYKSCHYLTSWYVSWGGEVPASGMTGSWSFRIGSSESHQGYQTPNIAYRMATGGGGFAPQTASAGDTWLGAMYRQIELMRWLQSSKGLIAGGVSNSWHGRYETPTDGRGAAKFYGMFYTYAPVWHDPPSNNWFGFQAWSMQRMADLFLEVSDKTSTLAAQVRPNVEIIMDRWMGWVLQNITLNTDGTFTLPDTLNWTSPTAISGKTATTPNLEGVYEFLPSLNWDGTGSYADFWRQDSVPNPNLDFTVVATGTDLGVAGSLALTFIMYAQAKRNMSKFTTAIPSAATKTPQDAYTLARELLDRIWKLYKDPIGITKPEQRGDFGRCGDQLYIPPNFTGTMPNGDTINSNSTFISIRSFMKSDPMWAQIQAYIDNPIPANVPTFTYHRFWANAEYAMACGAMHKYFSDLAGP